MALPLPAPIAYSGGGNVYQTTMRIIYDEWEWTEKWYAAVFGSTAPNVLMGVVGAKLAKARLQFLTNQAFIQEVRSSLVSDNPLTPVKQSSAGEEGADGAGTGKNNKAAGAPPWKAWYYGFWDESKQVHERRPFRGMSTKDDNWTAAGGYAPSTVIDGGIQAMVNVLAAPQTAKTANGSAQYCLRTNSLVPLSPPALVISSVSVDPATNRLQFSTIGTNPVQFGFNLPSSGLSFRNAVAGDTILVSGNRVSCLKGISGHYQIAQVTSSGTGATTTWTYTTTRLLCCSASALGLFQGTVRAQQYAYVPFWSAVPIKIGVRDTGTGPSGTRGRGRAGCCH